MTKVRLLLAVALLCAFSAHAQTAAPITQPHLTYFDGNGSPCSGCSLFTYAAGTTTPLATFTDSSGATQNTNPIILDAGGAAAIWVGSSAYKFALIDTFGTTLWTVDNVTSAGGSGGSITPGTQFKLPAYAAGGKSIGPLTNMTVDGTGNNFIIPGSLATGGFGFSPGGMVDPRSPICGAFGDFLAQTETATTTASSTTVSLSATPPAWVIPGMTIVIHGAGASGTTSYVGLISGVSGNTITTTTAVPTAVSGAWTGIGHDDTNALQTCISAGVAQVKNMSLPTPVTPGGSYLVTKSLQANGGSNFFIVGDSKTFGFNHSQIACALTEAFPCLDFSGTTRSGTQNIAVSPANGDPSNSLDTAAVFYEPIVGGQSPLFFALINSSFVGGHGLGAAACAIVGIDQVTIDGTQCMGNYVGLVGGDGLQTISASPLAGSTNITSKGNTRGTQFGCTLFRIDNSVIGGVFDTPLELEGCDTFQLGGMSYIGLNAPFGGGSATGGYISLLSPNQSSTIGSGWAVGDKFTIPGGTGGVGIVTGLFGGTTTPASIAIAPGGSGRGYTTGTNVAVTAIGPSTGINLAVNLTINVIVEIHQAGNFEPDQLFGHNFRTEDQGHVTGTCSFGLNGGPASKNGFIEGELDGGSGIEICGNGAGVLEHYDVDTFTNQSTLFGNLGGMFGSHIRLVNTPANFGTIGGAGVAFEGNRFDSMFSVAQIEAGIPATPGMNYICQETGTFPCEWIGNTFTIENAITVGGSAQIGGNATVGGTLGISGGIGAGLMTNYVRTSFNFGSGSPWTVTGSPTITGGPGCVGGCVTDSGGGNTGTKIVSTGDTTLVDINTGSPLPSGTAIACAEVKGAVGGETFSVTPYGFPFGTPTTATATTQYQWYCWTASRTIMNQDILYFEMPVAETLFIDKTSTTIGGFPGGGIVQWLGPVPGYYPTTGSQQLTPILAIVETNTVIATSGVPVRAGSVTITAATTQAVTFSPAMTVAPNSCSLTPTGSSASTGQPFATSLSTTGFTANVPTSGTLTMTYQCVNTNSN